MKKLFLTTVFFCSILYVYAQEKAKDYSKPEATEVWSPTPKIVSPGNSRSGPPSDAIILFDGKNQAGWASSKNGGESPWQIMDGILTTKNGTGNIQTKQKFGDCQLHIEFMMFPPENKTSDGHYNEGNSGVYLQERYEVQIYDSHQNNSKIYANGQAGSLYKQCIPMVNPTNKRGEWNTYDIYYTAPRFRDNGTVEKPAFITVVMNNVLIINHFEIQGTIQHVGIPRYEPHGKGAIVLQEHGSKVGFRNVWIREI